MKIVLLSVIAAASVAVVCRECVSLGREIERDAQAHARNAVPADNSVADYYGYDLDEKSGPAVYEGYDLPAPK